MSIEESNSRLLLVTQVFYPDEVSTANLFTDLCIELKNTNHIEIDVWCAQPSYSTFERQKPLVSFNNINIYYLPSTNFSKSHKIGRIINYFTFAISVFFKFIFKKDIPIVITHTTPPSLGILLSFLCKVKNKKLIYVLLDIFPEGLIRQGMLSENSIFTNVWNYINKKTLKNCSTIVVIGRDMGNWLKNYSPVVAEKCKYIPIWQNKKLFKEINFADNPFVLKYNLQSKFVVQYSGNMGLWNDMRTFAMAVNSEPKDVFFVFIGGGMRKKEFLNSLNENSPHNALIIPFLPNTDYSNSISACHVALISLNENLSGMAVPSKIMGIMAAGIPVIALVPDDSEIAMIVREEDCGIVVKPGDLNGLLISIDVLKNDPILCGKLGNNGKRAFNEKYSVDVVSKQYINLIKNV